MTTFKKIWLSPWKAFLCIGIAAGPFLVLWLPPFQGPDEYAHFLRAYHISEGHPLAQQQNKRVGGMLPAGLNNPAFAVFHETPFHAERRITFQQIQKARKVSFTSRENHFYDFVNTAIGTSTLCYLPQVAGILAGRILGLGVIDTSYAGRYGNLLAWLALMCMAIHLMPVHQWAMATIALSPVCFLQACSLSSDSTTITLAFLFTACVVRYAWLPEQRLTVGRVLLLFVLGIGVALSKLPYVMLLALLLVVFGKSDSGIINRRRQIVLIVVCAGITALCWALYVNAIYLSYESYNPAYRDAQALIRGADPWSQIRHIIAAPGDFGKALLSLSQQSYIPYSIFGWLGWDMVVPWQMGWVIGVFILMLFFFDGNAGVQLSWMPRAMALVAVTGVVSAIVLFLYLQWNPVGAITLSGIHGRYLLPLLPAAGLILTPRMRELPGWAKAYIPLAWLGMIMLTMLTILWRYYSWA